MRAADLVLLIANLAYATAPVATRVVVARVPPALLALLRLVLGLAILGPAARLGGGAAPPLVPADRRALAWMGVLGFAAAFALANWGVALSTATNAALLITVEPVTLVLLSPLVLGERLTRREAAGAVLAVGGATLIVADGVPGVSHTLVPHWRGDALLLLSGVAYAAYSLLGRDVLARHAPAVVTARSMGWGAWAVAPLAAGEWLAGQRPAWTAAALAGTLYLAVVITALGYLAWNWALARVPAPRAAVFLNVQPLAGALLGWGLLGEPMSAFTATGGALIVAGLALALRGRRRAGGGS